MIEQLAHEPTFPDAGRAGDGHDLEPPMLSRALERSHQCGPFRLPVDERRRMLTARVLAAPRPGAQGLPDGHRRIPPLDLPVAKRPVDDRVARKPLGRVVDKDPVGRGGGLEPRRRVDYIPGDRRLAGADPHPQVDKCLTGRDPHPDVQVEPLARRDSGNRGADRERRPDGPFGVVLVGDRGAEDRHHRVPDELLDQPAVALELLAGELVVRDEERANVLDVEALRHPREPDEVDEDDRHHLAHLASGVGMHRRAALEAETGAVRVLALTGEASRHGRRSLREVRLT
ncbi:MAG TPA: hypothetical protein VJN72_10890 [Gaiellales bacterium]|nr:hypothetical protein [Gaiellales bacterium]